DLAPAEQAQAVLAAAQETRRHERLGIQRLRPVEPLVVDRLLQRANVDLVVVLAAPLVEAALGQAAMQRHLAALATADGDARACPPRCVRPPPPSPPRPRASSTRRPAGLLPPPAASQC